MLRRAVVITVVLSVILVGPISGVMGAPATSINEQSPETAQNINPQSIPDQEFDTNVDNLSVWERSILPLRTDLSNAPTTVSNAQVFLQGSDEIDRNIERSEVGVFEADGENVTLEFENKSDANITEYEGQSVTIILAEADPSESPTIDDFSGLSLDMLTSLDQNDFDNLNANATFSTVDEIDALDLDEDGSYEFDINDPEAGQYNVLIAANEDNDEGLQTDNGDLVLPDSQSTIIGVESFLVQDSASTVAPDQGTIEPGEDVTFDITTDLDGNEDIGHVVALYDEDTFESEIFRLKTSEDFNSDLTIDDFTLEHDIEDVDGVANLEDDIEAFGISQDSDRIEGPQDLQDIITFTAGELDQDTPQLESIGDTTLSASVTAQVDDNTTEITVETLDSWEEGDYRFVHVASAEAIDQFATSDGTITLEEASSPTFGGGGSGSGGTSPPADDPDIDLEPPEPPEEVEVELDETANMEFDEETGTSTATFSENNNVESVTFQSQRSGGVNARNLDREPDETGPSPGSSVRVSQITVGEDLRNESATLRMRISLDRLEEIGADTENLRVNRYNADEGEWQGLETEPVEQTDTHVRVEAETPGFSYFSVSATSEPTAAIDAPAEVEGGDEVTLDGSASDDEYGEIVSYDWTVDGESLSGETVTATLADPGDVDIELTVTNDAGETDTASASVSVLEEDVGDPVDTPDEDAGDTVDDPDDGVSTSLGVIVVLLVVILGVGVGLYARGRDH